MKTFVVMDTEFQKTKEIQSNATTVAELKADLVANGFNVEGKTIQEALTRIEFKDDNSVLPHDVPYKGRITNNLVFRLTKSEKNIKSGMDRMEAYAAIKAEGLENKVKEVYGKNFTIVSTEDLVKLIEEYKTTDTKCEDCDKNENNTCPCEVYLRRLVNILYDNDTLYSEDVDEIFAEITEEPVKEEFKSSVYSADELDELFLGL